MACPTTVAKFVGTISLGLLTGLSYTLSTIVLPALESLPTASTAALALQDLQLRARRRIVALSNLTAISLFTAFALSSPRRKHPYLIWTGLVALAGGTGLEWWANPHEVTWGFLSSTCCEFGGRIRSGCAFGTWTVMRICGSSDRQGAEKRREEDISSANGSEIELVEQEEARSATPTAAELGDSDVNGETVQSDLERERKFQRLRTWLVGVGFTMGVVGIWGDRV